MSTELKTVCSFCMNCMRNYVQQEANCIAVPVRKKKKEKRFFFPPFLSLKLQKLCHFLCILRQLYKRLSPSRDFYVAAILCLSPNPFIDFLSVQLTGTSNFKRPSFHLNNLSIKPTDAVMSIVFFYTNVPRGSWVEFFNTIGGLRRAQLPLPRPNDGETHEFQNNGAFVPGEAKSEPVLNWHDINVKCS